MTTCDIAKVEIQNKKKSLNALFEGITGHSTGSIFLRASRKMYLQEFCLHIRLKFEWFAVLIALVFMPMANKRFERDAPTAGFAACFRAPQAKR